MSPHLDTLSWFRADQSFLFLLNAACLPEKQQISICIVVGMTRPGLEPTIYRTRGEHSNHYATMRFVLYEATWTWPRHTFMSLTFRMFFSENKKICGEILKKQNKLT